jgi:hypothetical protein
VKKAVLASLFCLIGAALVSMSFGNESAEPLLRDLPPGILLKSSAAVAPEQAKAIGQKLGGEIERLSNSVLSVHGRTIQVNAITAANDASAQSIEQALLKMKAFPFCLRKDRLVVEYVGKDIDAALATKTTFELGLLPKPKSVRYRVTAELAAIDRADYMSCNTLFSHFLALRSDRNEETRRQIGQLSQKFSFGHQLILRNPDLGGEPSAYRFEPSPSDSQKLGSTVKYSFAELPEREGVPFVTVTMDVTANETGLLTSQGTPTKPLRSATPFWPADDRRILALAQRITADKATNEAKATAILEWLTPGRNLKYSGETGSRWGVLKVLEQQFGHCWDFSDVFITLCRAAGVPSRQVAGWFYGSSGHVWAEYFVENKGWQQVDPTGGGKLQCGIYHLPYFRTEDGEMPIVYLALPMIETVSVK